MTITSQPKFLGLIGYHISLAMELRWRALPTGSAIKRQMDAYARERLFTWVPSKVMTKHGWQQFLSSSLPFSLDGAETSKCNSRDGGALYTSTVSCHLQATMETSVC